MNRLSVVLCLFVCGLSVSAQTFTATERGAIVETAQYRVEFRDGVVAGLVNKLTDEVYADRSADPAALTPYLPTGLGTQHSEAEREGALDLYDMPWEEHPVGKTWANMHRPHAGSAVKLAAAETTATLTYTGLTNGEATFADEVYGLELAIDGETGDLLITPFGSSPRAGVYGANLTLNRMLPSITAELPIFDGITLTPDMSPMMWHAMWANYWDYAFVALNGHRRGAIAIWAQDAELRVYKDIFHTTQGGGISIAVGAMNIPPFDELKAAKPLTWRLQAFDQSWAQAAARYRAWRDANVQIAPRPEYAKHISFVNSGVNAGKMWLDQLERFVGTENLPHTLTFAPDVRRAGFDKNHADNAPRDGLAEEMAAWKAKNARLMVYLNPVIMWGPKPTNEREHAGVKAAEEATTIMPFQPPGSGKLAHFDVQHLGHKAWQDWFVGWVNEYIQDYHADGIYHDEGQKTPLDSRGPINGMTSPQGRASYMYRVLAENPDSIHGAEHLTEVNLPGVSVGIGSGVHWGTADSMRQQRIRHASPVSNALSYPHGVTWAFPHQSQLTTKGESRTFNWGMDLQEGRGDIAGLAIQGPTVTNTDFPYESWRSGMWLERRRARLFVEHGLRPEFPAAYARDVLTYFRGQDGTAFRYVRRPWGTAFVQVAEDGSETLQYARITGAKTASGIGAGAISGWPVYDAAGPAGLDPLRYYEFDPALPRPDVYFSTNNSYAESFYEARVERSAMAAGFLYMALDAIPAIGRITRYDSTILHSATPPWRIYVNGKLEWNRDDYPDTDWSSPETIAATYTGKGQNGPLVTRTWWEMVDDKRVRRQEFAARQWKIAFQLPAQICVLTEPPARGLADLAARSTLRVVANDHDLDLYDPAFLAGMIQHTGDVLTAAPQLDRSLRPFHQELHVPLAPPADTVPGTLTIEVTTPDRCDIVDISINGVSQRYAVDSLTEEVGKKTVRRNIVRITLPMTAADAALLSVRAELTPTIRLTWTTPTAADDGK